MALRVVLYAEGRGETRGAFGIDPEPGVAIPKDRLGAGHTLLGRALSTLEGIPLGAVVFEGPLRPEGRTVVGSDLLVEKKLRRLVVGAVGTRTPDLIVFLIDDDGKNRYSGFARMLDELPSPMPRVPAVAVQEFEAWLLADAHAASGAVGRTVDESRELERLSPREAKKILKEWTGDEHGLERRIAIAASCDLSIVRKRCRSYARFENDARRAIAHRNSNP